jgi:Flp pilus assembly protein TadD
MRDEAIAQFEEAVRLRPGDARARRALSRLLERP